MSSQGQRHSLLTLPSELIDEIFSYFTPERDFEADWRIKGTPAEQQREDESKRKRVTLYKLCQVSKGFHRHAEPTLYSWVSVQGVGLRDTKQLRAILLKLASSPDLAQRVRYIEFFCDEDDGRPGTINDPDMISAIETIAADILGRDHLSQWKELFKLHVNASLAALILGRSSNLQHLSLSNPMQVWAQRDIRDPFRILGAGIVPHFHFLKLQVLACNLTRDLTSDSVIAFIHSLRTLPQLKYLNLNCQGVRLEDSTEPIPFEFPSLQTLILNGFGGTCFRYKDCAAFGR
jgi:hypothetical protein